MGTIYDRDRFHRLEVPRGFAFSRVFEDVVNPETCIRTHPVDVSLGGGLEDYFLLLAISGVRVSARHAGIGQFGQAHVFFLIGEIGHVPFFLFLVPLRVVDDVVDLVRSHQHGQNRRKFLYLLLLLANSIEEVLLFILMLILDVF